jgi:hypothetical protein
LSPRRHLAAVTILPIQFAIVKISMWQLGTKLTNNNTDKSSLKLGCIRTIIIARKGKSQGFYLVPNTLYPDRMTTHVAPLHRQI